MQDQGLSRRERDKIRQRRIMVDAARDLFAEKGFHHVTMQEIAARAEYAIGTLYSFFKSKEELYWSLVLEITEQFDAAMNDALESEGNEYEKILRYVHAKGSVFTANQNIMRLYFAELLGASYNLQAGLEGKIRELYEQIRVKLAGIFADGIQKGLFAEADPFDLAAALESNTSACLFLWMDNPGGYDYSSRLDAMVDIFFGPVLLNSSDGNDQGDEKTNG